ncbi:MAG: histidine kinase, partial [Prolixibacteraceae bacterium]
MKSIRIKINLVTILHILFWAISFNLFNSFFSRGVESGYVLDGLELTWGNVFLFNNVILVVLFLPFIWLVRNIKIWIKRTVTALFVLLLAYCAVGIFHPNEDNLVIALLLGYFLDNFIYVLIFHITIIAAVYLNFNLLVNKYLSTGKWGIYFFYAIILAIVSGVMNFALFDYGIDLLFPSYFYISWFRIWELILIISAYMAITTIVFLLGQYGMMLIGKQEKTQHELSALKEQINPHFLFNNLNTIYSMAVKGDDRTKDVVLQLSDFLRYVLYDTSSDLIPLEKEVEIIMTYFALQKERINPSTTKISLNITGDFGETLVAPLLLLPLAENCFKHGVGIHNGSIVIEISYKDGQLRFFSQNNIAP